MTDETTGSGVDESQFTSSAGGDNTIDQTTTNTPAEPDAYDLTDPNRLIRVAGQDKPVKFSDHVRGFQANWTRSAQEAARLKQELAARDQRLAQYEQEARRREQQQSKSGEVDYFTQMREAPYLTGEQAAEGFQRLAGEFQTRDRALLGIAQEVKKLQDLFKGVYETHSTQQFDGKIAKFIQDGGYDPEWTEFAKVVYSAYEGDDLDVEFPNILKQQIELAERLLTKKREAAVRQARGNTFLPGKGGNARPGKPLQLDPRASAADVANQLFDSLQGSGT